MKACPNCYLSFNDGYICPHCGGQLVDYSPEPQVQAANPYQGMAATQGGYYDQSMQSAAYQSQYNQPASQYYQPPANNFPPTIIKKRTGLVVFLTLIVLALAAFSGYLVYEEYQDRTKPSEIEVGVVGSAWEWYSSMNDTFTTIEEMNPTDEQDDAANSLIRGSSSQTKSTQDTADAISSEELQRLAETGGQIAPDTGAGTETGDGENAAAVASSPTSSPASAEDIASVQNSDVVPTGGSGDSTSEGNESSATGNADGTSSDGSAMENSNALMKAIDSLGVSMDQIMAINTVLAIVSNPGYLDTIDKPMQAMKEKYPELVSSWDGLKSAIPSNSENINQVRGAITKFRQAGESFKRTAEKSGFTL